MSLHVALLRAINVAGRNRVAMADLRKLLEELGFAGAQTLLQSGNLVFRSDRLTGAELEHRLEDETARQLLSVDYVVRTATEWKKLVARNPFPDKAERDPGHLLVMFLKSAPAARAVRELESAIVGPEMIRCDGKQLYIVYPEGIGRSKLTGTLIEGVLATRGTGRNWNTVLKLATLCDQAKC